MTLREIYNEVPTVLLKLRKQAGYVQQEVADKMGMDKATYFRLEKGTRDLSIHELLHIASIYDITPTTVLEMIQRTPVEWSEIKALKKEIDECKKQNSILRSEIEKAISKNAEHGDI